MKENKEYIKEFTRNNKLPILFMILKSIVDTMGAMLLAWVLMEIMNLLSKAGSKYDLLTLLMIGLTAFLLIMLEYLLEYISAPKFKATAVAQYNSYIFNKLTKKSIRAFSKEKSSHYISGLSNDLNQIEESFVGGYIEIFHIILLTVSALAMMLYYSATLTIASVLLSLLPILAALLTGNRLVRAEEEVSEENERYIGVLQDSINGFSVIKSFKAEGSIRKMVNARIEGVKKSKEHRHKLTIFVNFMTDSSAIILQLGIFFLGAYLALYPKTIGVGTVMLFVQLTGYILDPIEIIPKSLVKIKAAKALINKMAKALDENSLSDTGYDIANINTISLKNVSYSYNKESYALNNINLEFEENKSYAIVGGSGSGKSTILALLEGGLLDYSGEILYNASSLKDIRLASLYKHLSIIEQRVFIFDASIIDNITMFKEFKEEEIERAIRLSGLDELIANKGLDYLCGENGSNLSGGEKQRIAIARSLLQNCKLLLCDEITAALDNETATQISNSILELKDITRIVVTHSLNEAILKKYDEIIAMKDGNILERGTFLELMNNKGYFYSLFIVSQ